MIDIENKVPQIFMISNGLASSCAALIFYSSNIYWQGQVPYLVGKWRFQAWWVGDAGFVECCAHYLGFLTKLTRRTVTGGVQ